MKFADALQAMKKGLCVKLPSWSGYWCWDGDKNTVMMHCKDGSVLDIRETQIVEYTLRNICSEEWMLADKANCRVLRDEAENEQGDYT